ncbi:hypothetical protein [uncultured Gordonia sp.]|uniref:hypothetical protein n=2 Tax=uncultured Gordonia sp. TaxID=198437 RepID=UPI00258BAA4F|nr:hypothetical protein [uncultured Gordonia sp.]
MTEMMPTPVPCYMTDSLLDVVAFTDDGVPYVLDTEHGRLTRGRGSITVDDARVVSVMPAPDHVVTWTLDDGSRITEPLVGWGLRVDGTVVALATDPSGDVEALVESDHSTRFTITPRPRGD